MSASPKSVEVTHTVPVTDLETLRVYLVSQLADAGGTALDLIVGAGFTVKIVKTRKTRAAKGEK